MAHLGRIEVTITDPLTGLPVSGATVEIRKQGGTVNGTTGPTTIDLHRVGAIDVGDTLNIDADTDATDTVATQPSSTQITMSGVGLSPLVNDVTRVTVVLPLPSIFNAEDGSESKAGPHTTDANGLYFAYAPVGFYDMLVTRGAVKTLLTNVMSLGGTSLLSNVFNTGSAIFYTKNTHRALTTGDIIEEWKANGVRKMSILDDGQIDPVGGIKGPVSVTGGDLTLDSDLVFSAAVSQIVPGATSLALRNNADSADNLLITDVGAATIRDSLTVTNHPRVMAHNSGAVVITSSAIAAMAWDTEDYDTHAMHAPGDNTKITIPAGESGLYIISSKLTFEINSTGRRSISIKVNNSAAEQEITYTLDAQAVATVLNVCAPRMMTAADFIQVFPFQDSGGDLDILAPGASPNAWIRVHRIA